MAKRTIVVVSDDLDGTEGNDVETVYFAVQGQQYAIDLSATNRKKFEKDLQKYVAAAREERDVTPRRRRGRTVSTPSKSRPAASREHTQAVREYLRSKGHQISSRGRIPQQLQEIFDRDHEGDKALSAAS